MSKRLYNEEDVANTAKAIRRLTGKLEKVKASEFASEIDNEVQKIEAALETIKARYGITEEDLKGENE